jgi:hypothetical protein
MPSANWKFAADIQADEIHLIGEPGACVRLPTKMLFVT